MSRHVATTITAVAIAAILITGATAASAPGQAPPVNQTPPKCFEEALAELEQILAEIEGGSVGLEESLVKYERGNFLIQHSHDKYTSVDFTDYSVHEPFDEKWKTNCRARIAQTKGTIVMVGLNTAKAEAVLWEKSEPLTLRAAGLRYGW